MALRFRRLLISVSRQPIPVSGNHLFFSTSSNANNSTTLISVSDRLIHQHDFSPSAALELSSNKFLLTRPEKVYSLITLLKDSGFSQSQLEKAIQRCPILLSYSAGNVQPKIKVFVDLGFEASEIAKMLSADPRILERSAELLLSNISVLKGILGSDANVCHALRLPRSRWYIKDNLDKTLATNIELLKKCGVCSDQIAKYAATFPRCLLLKPNRIREFIEIADRMGVPRQSGWYLYAIRTLSSMSSESWGLKLELLRSLGLSENDILHIFRSMPLVLAVSERKLRDVFNIMVGVGKVHLSQLVSNPAVLFCSVEKRIRPRLEVYQLLERKNLLKTKIKVTTFCRLTKKEFLKFMSRFEDDLGDEFVAIKKLNGL